MYFIIFKKKKLKTLFHINIICLKQFFQMFFVFDNIFYNRLKVKNMINTKKRHLESLHKAVDIVIRQTRNSDNIELLFRYSR